ncbi:MAG TPA: Ppx/GppA phosphatase family protein [Acidimicrobiales bacterium]|nr:Ppx/GppA phosphatase family protein [Acidimicrobiales bacterium]
MRIGALDLGSNSFHLLVVEGRADGSFEALVREKEMLRLGDEVARRGAIGGELADRAVEVVGGFRTLAEAAGAEELTAMATAALREAANGGEVIDRLEVEAGVPVEVISGAREAELIFRALRSSVVIEPSPALALDLGGGSLEIMVGDATGLTWATSVRLGVGRLTAEVHDDPPSPADVDRVRQRVSTTLGRLAGVVADLGPKSLVGSSGTLCTLARMADAHRSGQVPASVNQLTVDRADLEAVHDRLLALPAADRRRLPGLEASRAELIPAGSLLLLCAMDLFGLDQLTVSEWALREGMVLTAIGAHDPADWGSDPGAIREASVRSLCRRCGYGAEHAAHVARLAVTLFDRTRSLHRLGDQDRELLHYGALLHDIGEHVSTEGHDRHTAYLILNGKLRGLTPDEINVLACLGRFHRRGTPKAGYEAYDALDARWRHRVVRLVALLRVADALDRSHDSVVADVHVELRRDQVRLWPVASGEVTVARWALRRKGQLFEALFRRSLELLDAPDP